MVTKKHSSSKRVIRKKVVAKKATKKPVVKHGPHKPTPKDMCSLRHGKEREQFTAKEIHIETGGIIVCLMLESQAKQLDLRTGDRVLLTHGKHKVTAVLDTTHNETTVPCNSIGLFEETRMKLKAKDGQKITVKYQGKPKSFSYIKEKMHGQTLSKEKIHEIIKDIVDDKLTDIEKTAFVMATYQHGFSMKETADLTRAMVNTGHTLKFNNKIVIDKHCLSWDVPVIVKENSNIKIREIGKIIDSLFEIHKDKIELRDGAEYLENEKIDLMALTFSDDYKSFFSKISGFFRAKSPELIHEITLRGNRKITVTEDHSIFTLQKGCVVNIPAREINVGDYVLVPSKIQKNKTTKSILSVPKAKNNRFKSISKVNIDSHFMRLLAYYIAEGFTNEQGIFLNFGSHEKSLIEDAKICVKKVFGFEATLNKPHDTATRLSVYSQIVSEFFIEVVKAGSNALEKTIPPFVFEQSRELQLEFLQAIFLCDGHIRRGYEACYVTASKQLRYDLEYLLATLGMSTSTHVTKPRVTSFPAGDYQVNEAYYIYTQAREIYGNRKNTNVSFLNLIPISELGEVDLSSISDSELKRKFKRQKYLSKGTLKRCISSIKSEDVKNIINNNLSLLEVKSNEIVPSKSEFVYDFFIEKYNRFFAGSSPIAIHNCIGGVPNNRTTMIVGPILSAVGLTMPKTSSRAITSPAGTADTMECLANVELTKKQIINTVKRAGVCLIHGGSLNLAPADDKIIEIERPLSVDATGQLLASVMAKKASVGSNIVLIDIPKGPATKTPTLKEANELRDQFIELGKRLKIKVHCIITDGRQPIGNGVGPVLEAIDVMRILKRDHDAPKDLEEKSLMMAGILLELAKKARKNQGYKMAKEILESGKAFTAMQKIIKLQGAKEHPALGSKIRHFKASKAGKVKSIDNLAIAKIARVAGAPFDKGAGLYLYKKIGDKVKKGENLFTVYAYSKDKLRLAENVAREQKAIIY